MNPKNNDSFFNRGELRLLGALAEARGCRSIRESCYSALGGGDCMPDYRAEIYLEQEYFAFQRNKSKKKKSDFTLNEKVFDLYEKVQKLIAK
jgi:hypothetical protein